MSKAFYNKTMKAKKQDNRKIRKEPDTTNLKDLPDYIWPFIHLFNKKKFEKLSEQRE